MSTRWPRATRSPSLVLPSQGQLSGHGSCLEAKPSQRFIPGVWWSLWVLCPQDHLQPGLLPHPKSRSQAMSPQVLAREKDV